MNYIITGGTGFIGTHLTNLLCELHPDAKVWNLDIVDPAKLDVMTNEKERQEYTTIKDWKSPLVEGETRKSTFVYCDVRKPIENLPFTPTSEDILFNFAAVHRTPGHPDHAYFETNIRGAENVCAFCEKYGIKKMVFTSSIAPYGAAEELKKETTLPTPNTAYGISKLVAEKIHMMWQADDQKDRQLTIVRPGVVFGRGENGNFTRLYWAIKGHKFAFPGRKDTIKACIYVKELVRFMLYRLENHGVGVELYNCCYEPAYTIEHIVDVIKSKTGLTQFVPNIPNAVIMPVAAVIGALGAPMGICPARVKKLQISTNICGKKMKNSGYDFKWSFEGAVEDWFIDNKKKYLK
ncbi:NAD-dependent epimerase/dehydratase family protein [Segatella bryantii]|uniref:NAD-dependent epimerase/dehydratase family protein n=1 Tax=Segatella bryantii TaxID=77095 RepID=UPI002433070A|nr:NAD(P)-dependent oxidoreductase [Segatella bryantii]